MNNMPLILEMTEENGQKTKVELVSRFVDNGINYIIANDLSNKKDSYILKLVQNNITKEYELISIDNEEEFNRVCQIADKIES